MFCSGDMAGFSFNFSAPYLKKYVMYEIRVIGCSEKNFKRGPFDLGQFEVAEHESELKKNRLIFFLGHPADLLLGA